MRAVRVLLLCGLGMLGAAGCDSGTPPPAVHTVTVTPSSSAQPSTALSSVPSSSSATRVFDSRAMASAVTRLLTTDYKLAHVGAVSCPDRQPVADGSRFQCTVDIAGTTKHVPITVTGADGNYRVDPPQ
ncbi:DUF4333 domain-containing protein [Amycolatopsis echigonensis]|uniref:DUF4333 domain-containing protein n=1 Tax=Amycolatopsis echigonensis TaxID=2576905 RepID=A0A2N3WTD4_9PSEU|nr:MULTISPECIES: DUF4333 domain-containing protein [Amycolatopsis]MBB2505281.1 DUF4333 domain-containing protein [Amycolatopsis echigonensis]PKV97126.1 uncharacterized protein DUF4333 [Amycolatopsis niigatensis]